jgi:integrase
MAAGINERHGKACASRAGRPCDCKPTYCAEVYDVRVNKRHRKTFPTLGAAKSWRQDMAVAVRRGEVAATTTTLAVGDLVTEWLDAAGKGQARTRGRKPFAAGTIRAVEQNYRLRVADRFVRRRADRLTLIDLQDWVDELDADGMHAGTIETSVLPLRMAYRRAKTKGIVAVDPTDGLELPQKPVKGASRRPPAAEDIRALLAATPAQDRAAWTVLVLTGIRRGELRGLRWSDVDLDAGVIHVETGEGFKVTKGRRNRKVPCGPTLAAALREHRLATGRRDGLVFGEDGERPVDSGKLQQRADTAWKNAKVGRVTPHVCRHLYATLMAAAGTPIERLSRYMGHSSIAVTWDNYGHLFPGDEAADSTLQEAFLAERLSRGLSRDVL